MFIDEAKVNLEAGTGGDGAVSFRRERFVPKGGPDGGDGGDGGDIILLGNRHIHDLSVFNVKKKFKAKDGENGKTKKMKGKDGDDLILNLPIGTEVIDTDGSIVADLVNDGAKKVVAKGGQGGWGNYHFKTSVKQAPAWSKKGLSGKKLDLLFHLKTIADVGLIGLPNAGKSTLLSTITNAKPKIADYPFTTLEPNLGAIKTKDKTIIIADIPGLIEGASKGKGLGDKFLKHIERTKILVHLIDSMSDDVVRDYKIIRSELKDFSPKLLRKKEIVVLNKIDVTDRKELKEKIDNLKEIKINPLTISSATKANINVLIKNLL